MRTLILAARILSSVFRPTYYPLVGFFILFTFTYMSVVPWQYKACVLGVVYLFTVFMPALGIYCYRRIHGLSALQLRIRHRRAWPYIISLVCYFCCLRLMQVMRLPMFMGAIIASSLLIHCVCLVVNMRWKISMHSAGAGGIIGSLMAYASIFGCNPVWWPCGGVLFDGLVTTSGKLLRQHTLGQVLGGSAVGIVCGYFGIILT